MQKTGDKNQNHSSLYHSTKHTLAKVALIYSVLPRVVKALLV